MPAAPEQSEQARPGVLKRGWLFKEGAHTLSRAFPSRRFCIVVDGRLEYYEERQVLLRLLPDGSTGVSLNKWNLVLHEQNDGQGVLVGDIITKVNGMDLGLQMLNDVVSSAPRRAGAHRAGRQDSDRESIGLPVDGSGCFGQKCEFVEVLG